MRKLSFKESKFIEHYCGDCNGNGTESYKQAGYAASNDNIAGANSHKLLQKNKIIAAIEAKMAEISKKNDIIILNRLQRQQFWSEMLADKSLSASDRLRASELLGKSEADFTLNVNNAGSGLNINVSSAVVEDNKPDIKLTKVG